MNDLRSAHANNLINIDIYVFYLDASETLTPELAPSTPTKNLTCAPILQRPLVTFAASTTYCSASGKLNQVDEPLRSSISVVLDQNGTTCMNIFQDGKTNLQATLEADISSPTLEVQVLGYNLSCDAEYISMHFDTQVTSSCETSLPAKKECAFDRKVFNATTSIVTCSFHCDVVLLV